MANILKNLFAEFSEPTNLLKPFSRALNNGSPKAIHENYRKLYEMGESIIPVIESEILAYKWGNIKYGSQIKILTGLLSLANDINETRAKELGQKLKAEGCNEAVTARINSILEFSLDDFIAYSLFGIDVFQSKDLCFETRIRKNINKWLSRVSKGDLKNIERLYLIPNDGAHLGTYQPILCNIMIVWDMPYSSHNPLSFLKLLTFEHTLYHEIGHHVHRHTFGQIPSQEKEANRYAAILFKKAHPFLRRFLKTIKITLGFVEVFQRMKRSS